MNKCPFCASDKGFYTKVKVKGSAMVFCEFGSSIADNTDLYKGFNYISSKYAYCSNCDKRLFKVVDWRGECIKNEV